MQCEDTDTQEEHHVMTEAEIGGIWLQAKEHIGQPEPGRGKEGSNPRRSDGSMTLPLP